MPPAITSTRGGNRVTSFDDTTTPVPTARANGMKPTPARSAL
jgi:hypothetical protein